MSKRSNNQQQQNKHGIGRSTGPSVNTANNNDKENARMIREELSTAKHIKSRVTRNSVLTALKSVQHRLKLIKDKELRPNGVVIFCGYDIVKQKQICISVQPLHPTKVLVYRCGNRFYLKPLLEQLRNGERFGFVVIDGNGYLFATVSGNSHTILTSQTENLPTKTRRGGQVNRLRDMQDSVFNKRNAYIKKVALELVHHFVSNNKVNVSGLILAGCGDLKSKLANYANLDPRIKAKILTVVNVGHGQQSGFHEAIRRASKFLHNASILKGKKIISKFMQHIAMDDALYAIGIKDTLAALQMSAVKLLILCQNLEFSIVSVLKHNHDVKEIFPVATHDLKQRIQECEKARLPNEIIQHMSLAVWLVRHVKDYGAKLHLICDTETPEALQFLNGLGGIGGILRYPVHFEEFDEWDSSSEAEEDEPDDNLSQDPTSKKVNFLCADEHILRNQ